MLDLTCTQAPAIKHKQQPPSEFNVSFNVLQTAILTPHYNFGSWRHPRIVFERNSTLFINPDRTSWVNPSRRNLTKALEYHHQLHLLPLPHLFTELSGVIAEKGFLFAHFSGPTFTSSYYKSPSMNPLLLQKQTG